MKLKMYVWENVLGDWTPGLLVVYAHSKAEAIRMIKKEDLDIWESIKKIKPECCTKPKIVCVYGGS